MPRVSFALHRKRWRVGGTVQWRLQRPSHSQRHAEPLLLSDELFTQKRQAVLVSSLNRSTLFVRLVFKCRDLFKSFFSNFRAFKNHLENWWRTDSWASPRRFRFSGSDVGPENWHSSRVSRWPPAAGPQPTLSYWTQCQGLASRHDFRLSNSAFYLWNLLSMSRKQFSWGC